MQSSKVAYKEPFLEAFSNFRQIKQYRESTRYNRFTFVCSQMLPVNRKTVMESIVAIEKQQTF